MYSSAPIDTRHAENARSADHETPHTRSSAAVKQSNLRLNTRRDTPFAHSYPSSSQPLVKTEPSSAVMSEPLLTNLDYADGPTSATSASGEPHQHHFTHQTVGVGTQHDSSTAYNEHDTSIYPGHEDHSQVSSHDVRLGWHAFNYPGQPYSVGDDSIASYDTLTTPSGHPPSVRLGEQRIPELSYPYSDFQHTRAHTFDSTGQMGGGEHFPTPSGLHQVGSGGLPDHLALRHRHSHNLEGTPHTVFTDWQPVNHHGKEETLILSQVSGHGADSIILSHPTATSGNRTRHADEPTSEAKSNPSAEGDEENDIDPDETSSTQVLGKAATKRRGAFEPDKRKQTAETRKRRACIRCRIQKKRVRVSFWSLPCNADFAVRGEAG